MVCQFSYAGASKTIKEVDVEVGIVDIIGGYKINGNEGVEKGFYILGGFSSLIVEAKKEDVNVTISSGFTFTGGLLYKYEHFYGIAKYNFKLTSVVLGVGYDF